MITKQKKNYRVFARIITEKGIIPNIFETDDREEVYEWINREDLMSITVEFKLSEKRTITMTDIVREVEE